jgi:glucose/arabinose dehydrogenase
VFSHGHRNSFGFDFDPRSGNLWLEENADDTFTEIRGHVRRGSGHDKPSE